MSQIIHIGFPKTGTTWMQENLYPLISNYYFDKHDFKKMFLYGTKETILDYKNKISKIKNLIISAETLSTNKNSNFINWQEKANKLHETFDSPKIIIFIRNQLDVIPALYSDHIKNGGTLSFNDFIKQSESRLMLWNYYNQIKYYINLFSKKNVFVFMFEDFKKNPNLFITNFCKLFDFKIDIGNLNFKSQNKSYNKIILKLSRKTNHIFKSPNNYKLISHKNKLPFLFKTSHKFYSQLNSIKNSKTDYNKNEELKKFVLSFLETNNLILNELKIDIAKYKYPLK